MQKNFKILICLILFSTSRIYSQQDTVRMIVRANVTKTGIIQLRWASNSPSAWRFSNTHGVILERYTLMRNGGILDTPEKLVLTPVPLKPPVLDAWKDIAQKDQKAAVIAQALYGKDFEMSGGRQGVGEMIALSQEQEQRFAMSLYAADQSYAAAMFAQWGFEDKTAAKGERYLYRVIPVGKSPKKFLEAGSVYIGVDDYRELPKPLELNGTFGNKSVLVTWNYKLLETTYNTYNIERSTDGISFKRLNKNPLLNFTGGERMFYTDSIENSKMYYYRITGLTPFGEEGAVSDTIKGQGTNRVNYTSHITRIMPQGNGVNVEWEFPEIGNKDILKFELQRSASENGIFETVVKNIAVEKRSTVYSDPLPENYLRIAAIPKEGEPTYSYPFLFQQPDSIPPAVPVGLHGVVDSVGVVHLNWNANAEVDLLGYRILRGQTEKDDLIPLNDIAIRTNSFTDTISLKTLNSKVFYAVAAIDKRYNQSPLCHPVSLKRPLEIKPSSPYITLCEPSDDGIRLEWVAGKEDVTSYAVWRGESNRKKMKLIKIIHSEEGRSFVDKTVLADVNYIYQVVSSYEKRDSDPSPAVGARKQGKASTHAVKEFTGQRTEKGILLKWKLLSKDFKSVSIYRKEADGTYVLWHNPELHINYYLDNATKRNIPYEYMIVLKDLQGRPIQTQTKVD